MFWVDSCQSATGVGWVVPQEHSEARDSLLEREDTNDTVRNVKKKKAFISTATSHHHPVCHEHSSHI